MKRFHSILGVAFGVALTAGLAVAQEAAPAEKQAKPAAEKKEVAKKHAVDAVDAVDAVETGTISGRVKNRWVTRFPAVVAIAKIEGKTFAPPKEPVVMDQDGKVFKPRVLPILVGTKVEFLNSDPFEHNVLSPKPKFNLGKWGQGKSKRRVFETPGAVTLLCNLHPEMIGYVVVCETPYYALTDKKGRFTIEGIPPGEYTLVTWHERLKPASKAIVVTAGETAKVTLRPKKR